jgi:hypothetical protein
VIASRVHHASAQAGGHAADPEAVGCGADVRADSAELLDNRVDAVRLLEPELRRARDDGLAARVTGSEREQG